MGQPETKRDEPITGSEIFAEYIAEIKNDGIRELVVLTMDKIGVGNRCFFSAPASSSGKYHPSCANVKPGGLVRHVIRAIDIGKHIARALEFTPTQTDIVIAALIMHDIWKNDYKRHATRASAEIMETIRENQHLFKSASYEVLLAIAKSVQLHMGPWTEKSVRKPIRDYTLVELAVYLADYLSSRPDIGTTKDKCSLDLIKAFFNANN